MNYLEGIISERLENTGTTVARNHKVGCRVKGGWSCELDVIAYISETNIWSATSRQSMRMLGKSAKKKPGARPGFQLFQH